MVKKAPITSLASDVEAGAVIKEVAVAAKPRRKSSPPAQPVALPKASSQVKASSKVKASVQSKALPPPVVAASALSINVVRDGFTMPQDEYDALKALKAICLKEGVAVKKSELLRAGLKALTQMPTAKLIQAVSALPLIKSGRKKKS